MAGSGQTIARDAPVHWDPLVILDNWLRQLVN